MKSKNITPTEIREWLEHARELARLRFGVEMADLDNYVFLSVTACRLLEKLEQIGLDCTTHFRANAIVMAIKHSRQMRLHLASGVTMVEHCEFGLDQMKQILAQLDASDVSQAERYCVCAACTINHN